ncbi:MULTISPECIES: SlyX family protein [unclassified Aggregatibacter]|jgi:protein slyX homolog|uniref:SlyX family protein n=1 Tax=unclassified Aggregatibacter TaxID=2639383 RepID=UPI0003984653|nr:MULTISPECIES: SlyX family protein [unclassified Aggregatibacter]ERH28674.1 SlyX family protein [Aggregatibacter sp. oral taxon 458 str. W10330]QTO01842.1 SlyX family protein [Aggregatibacter sp. 2125159857]VTX58732.1 Protein SlyX [uncultured Aggregatibacter sp.]
MSISKNLEPRIAELEMKLTFQETIIEELNQALIEQQFLIDKMQVQLRYLVNKLKDVQPSNIATQAEETPPPHY